MSVKSVVSAALRIGEKALGETNGLSSSASLTGGSQVVSDFLLIAKLNAARSD